MTLAETIISLALLIVCGLGGVYAFMLLNRYAARERDVASAKALCQERIEQALTMPFRPPSALPSVTGQDNNLYSILGTSTYYTSSGIYTGAQTFTEPVTVYTAQDTTASAVAGTRTTTVTPALLVDAGGAGSLGMVQMTVTVAYVVNGESRTYSMYMMRGSD